MIDAAARLLSRARRRPGPPRTCAGRARSSARSAALERAGVVSCFAGGAEPVFSIAPGRQHVAAFYRNGALHHFLNRAIVELAMRRIAADQRRRERARVERAWEDALALRDLLKFEFFFTRKTRFREELLDELDVLDWRPPTADGLSRADAADVLASARHPRRARALRSFVEAQLVVADRLAARDPREAVDKDEFLAECLGVRPAAAAPGPHPRRRVRLARAVRRRAEAGREPRPARPGPRRGARRARGVARRARRGASSACRRSPRSTRCRRGGAR